MTRKSPDDMAFNTAIFYDVENLLKGYSFSSHLLNNLSLREILESVDKTGLVKGIAVQRAYANWSDARLAVMRGEISELGIDPVQVFGFSRDQKKNAADIQLVVDAVDLAHVRPAIEVFVIVSGDGGFAALAKKLHEYGKTVIGCAYPTAANRVLRSVCDAFVPIPDPEDEREVIPPARPQPPPAANGKPPKPKAPQAAPPPPASLAAPSAQTTPAAPSVHPVVRRMAAQFTRREPKDRQDMMRMTREVIEWLGREQAGALGRGLHLATVGEALRQYIADFAPEKAGFAKLADFLQWVCAGTQYQVARLPGGVPAVAERAQPPADAELLPDLDETWLHSPEHYRSCLRAGLPIYRLPEMEALRLAGAFLLTEKPAPLELGPLIEMVSARHADELSLESVKRALLCFHSAGFFLRDPEGAPLAEQRLSLKPELQETGDLVEPVRKAVLSKLASMLGRVDDAVFEEMLARPS